jgi:hypothetical protein
VTGEGVETPTGTVKLMNGTEMVGEATLINGKAALTEEHLATGTTELTANYGGDTTHSASTSNPFKQVVSDSSACATLGDLPRSKASQPGFQSR